MDTGAWFGRLSRWVDRVRAGFESACRITVVMRPGHPSRVCGADRRERHYSLAGDEDGPKPIRVPGMPNRQRSLADDRQVYWTAMGAVTDWGRLAWMFVAAGLAGRVYSPLLPEGRTRE